MSMRDVQALLRSIVEGLGADGSLGVAAQARAVPVDRFRTTEVPDPSTYEMDGSAVDRATNVSLRDPADLIPRNVYCNERQVVAVLEVRVAYVAAPSLSGLVHDEADPDEAAADWAIRALDDARTLERALTWYELTSPSPAITPVIEQVKPLGPAQTTDLGGGRGLLTRRFEVWMEDTQP